MRTNCSMDRFPVLRAIRKEEAVEARRSPPYKEIRSVGEDIFRQQNSTWRPIEPLIKEFKKPGCK